MTPEDHAAIFALDLVVLAIATAREAVEQERAARLRHHDRVCMVCFPPSPLGGPPCPI